MFPTWRMKLREARIAFQSGRYDEASNLLERAEVRDFLPAKRLAYHVAARIVARAEQRLSQGDTLAGWNDLSTADRLGGHDAAVDRLKQQYAERALDEIRHYLSSGDADSAVKRLDRLARKGLAGTLVRVYRQVAELMDEAERAALKGRLAQAVTALDRALMLVDANEAGDESRMEMATRLRAMREKTAKNEIEIGRRSGELHQALASGEWSAVLSAAEAILAISPAHSAAGQARERAWQAVGMESTRAGRKVRNGHPVSLIYGKPAVQRGLGSTRPSVRSFEDDTVNGQNQSERYLLWIDAVGGFLVCLDDYIVLGQPAPDQSVTVPILGDISRRHAVIRRSGGDYILEPLHETYVAGHKLSGPTVLLDNQTIQLGSSVRMRFSKPHALSSTARLTMESNHKTQPSADAIILMADSCVLGPNSHCHIRTRDWKNDVILFQQEKGLMCRTACDLTVDDQPVAGPVSIAPGTRVDGEDFSLSVEKV